MLIKDVIDGDFDIFCLTETNVAWYNVPSSDQPTNRFRGKLKFSKYITSHNQDKEYKGKQQSGGKMTICRNNICSRIIETGKEGMLGRWSWVKIRGNKGLSIIIATVYRPV
jgi:hypothetical protein